MSFTIGVGPNIRKSPYFDAAVADGAQSLSVYNHMYLPAHFGDPDAEYNRLVNGVAMWDVGAQRQVEIRGADAEKLVDYLCARDVTATRIGQGRYVPICNHDGILINDPVLLRLATDHFWLSIADSDIELWSSAIAAERGYDVDIREPDVSPLAIQGPKSPDVAEILFGDWIHELGYFGFRETVLGDIPLVLARSGWSKQGGFELYLRDSARGSELWQRVKDAGAAQGIGPGAPNDVERLESGLLSYGADCRLQVDPANPFELGLDAFIDLDGEGDFIGKQALLEISAQGPARRRVGYFVEGAAVSALAHPLPVTVEGERVGSVTEMAHSQRLGRNIATGLLACEIPDSAGNLEVELADGARHLEVASLPFIR